MSKARGLAEMDDAIILEDEEGNPFPVEVLGAVEHEG